MVKKSTRERGGKIRNLLEVGNTYPSVSRRKIIPKVKLKGKIKWGKRIRA